MPTTYYVSSSGSDGNAGNSTGSPWATIAKVNSSSGSGDTINFHGGDTFNDATLIPKANQTIQSYGTGKAIIAGGSSPSMQVTDVAGWTITNLEFTADDANDFNMNFTNTTGSHLTGCTLSNNKIHGGLLGVKFEWGGIGAGHDHGFSGLTISGNEVYHCQDAGIIFGGYDTGANDGSATIRHPGLLVTLNNVHDIFGATSIGYTASGSCIVLFYCSGTCSYNEVHDSQATFALGVAPCGIITALCDSVIISNNHVYNLLGAGTDAAGIDLDLNTTNSIVEYNYVHDVYSNGMEFWSSQNNVIRFNLIVNCNRDPAGIAITGSLFAAGSTDCTFHNNTVFLDSNGGFGAVAVKFAGDTGTNFVNNIILTDNNLHPIFKSASSTFGIIRGNVWTSGGRLNLDIEGTTYTTLSAAQGATTFENYSSTPSGWTAHPMLSGTPGTAQTVTAATLTSITDYQPSAISYLNGAGVDVATLLSTTTGGLDFIGGTLRSPYSVGAFDAPASSAAGKAIGFVTIIEDNFTRTNTSTGSAGTTTGAGRGWIDVNGSCASIDTNRLKMTEGSGNWISLIRPSQDTCLNSYQEVGITTTTAENAGMYQKYFTDSTNVWNILLPLNNFGGLFFQVSGNTSDNASAGTSDYNSKTLDIVSFQQQQSGDVVFSEFDTYLHSDGSLVRQFAKTSSSHAALDGPAVQGFSVNGSTIFWNYANFYAWKTAFGISGDATSFSKSSSITLNLTGTGTYWGNEPPNLTATGGTVTGVTASDHTHCAVTVSTGSGSQLLLADSSNNLLMQFALTGGSSGTYSGDCGI